jgi:glycerol kinase
MNKYVLGIDQSTQGTKGLLFDEKGALVCFHINNISMNVDG